MRWILTLPLVDERSNWASWFCIMMGMSLVSLPDVDEWRTVTVLSSGTVMVMGPDVVFAFRADGVVVLVTVMLPDMLRSSIVSYAPVMFIAPDVVFAVAALCADEFSSVILPDMLSASVLPYVPDRVAAPDVLLLLSVSAVESDMRMAPDVLASFIS